MAREKQSWRFGIAFIGIGLCIILSGCSNDAVEEISLKKLATLPSEHSIVVVNFWATWCPPCLSEIPHLNRLKKERPDVQIYGISIDDAALGREVFKFVEKYRIQYPIYVRERLDKDASNQEWYQNVDAIPVTYIFKDGKLHNTILGAVDKKNELADAIDGPSEEEQYADADEDSGDEESYEEEEE